MKMGEWERRERKQSMNGFFFFSAFEAELLGSIFPQQYEQPLKAMWQRLPGCSEDRAALKFGLYRSRIGPGPENRYLGPKAR